MPKKSMLKYDDYGRECSCCHEYKAWGEFNNRTNGFMNHACECKQCVHSKYKYNYDLYKAKLIKQELLKAEPIEIKKEYKPRYELPNIDEVIGFKCIEREEEFYY